MGAGSVAVIALVVFVVFTLILGGGIVFYQDSIAQHADAANPLSALLNQGAIIVIMLMFFGGAILFLAGAARWVAKH